MQAGRGRGGGAPGDADGASGRGPRGPWRLSAAISDNYVREADRRKFDFADVSQYLTFWHMDKREAVRVPVRVPALCRSQEGVVIDGTVEDLSRTGLFLRASEVMAEGSSAEIHLNLPGEEPLQLSAEVVRVEHTEERAGMALRIVHDAQDCRPLANFIMRQHATLR